MDPLLSAVQAAAAAVVPLVQLLQSHQRHQTTTAAGSVDVAAAAV